MSRIFAIHAVLEIHAATEMLMTSINELVKHFPTSLHLKAQQALISYHLRGAQSALTYASLLTIGG
jgi:anaphase-promoting complex subunit 8